MSEISFNELVAYCVAQGLPHQVREADEAVVMALPGRQGTHVVQFRRIEERTVVLARAGCLLTAPPERRAVIAQAVAHLNTQILLGAFCLDLTNGAVALDLPLLYTGVGLSSAQVERCLSVIGWTLDTHLPTLQRLCWTQDTVEEALGLPLASPLRQMLDALPASDHSLSEPA
jgi:hypothetical protein